MFKPTWIRIPIRILLVLLIGIPVAEVLVHLTGFRSDWSAIITGLLLATICWQAARAIRRRDQTEKMR
jgi:hypothetical protein